MEMDQENNIIKILSKGENYIFPCANLGKYLYKFFNDKGINIKSFVDNKKQENNEDIPIIKLNEIKNKNANIIIASINYMNDLSIQVKEAGFNNVFQYGFLTSIYRELQNFNQSFIGLSDDYLINKEKYDNLYNIFEDEKSKQVLSAIIDYRKNFNIEVYNKIYDPNSIQYFEKFLTYMDVFVDGGSYDGQNTIDYINFNPEYKKIYAFEPDLKSMLKVKENLNSYKNIEYYQEGISDNQKVLLFNDGEGLGSLVSENGNVSINVVKLDDIVKEDKAYIKLDIEGEELNAINGAQRLIKNGSLLAICVYHKPSDIWILQKRISELNPNYKYKLRHYSTTLFETVLYAIP